MLGLSALTAGTLAAGATGTLAWFTTNKTATAVYNKITAQGTQGNLNISITGVTDADANGSEGKTTEAASTISKTADVSSTNGLTFAQPDWKAEAGNLKGYYKVKDVLFLGHHSFVNLTNSCQIFTIAKVSSSQYFNRLCLAVCCSSGDISLIFG